MSGRVRPHLELSCMLSLGSIHAARNWVSFFSFSLSRYISLAPARTQSRRWQPANALTCDSSHEPRRCTLRVLRVRYIYIYICMACHGRLYSYIHIHSGKTRSAVLLNFLKCWPGWLLFFLTCFERGSTEECIRS